ncbi:MAG: patatin-like phospholipase family protein [Acidimicrobiales bacterium]
MAADSNVRTAIVLQGGGALGAYEFGVLKALYERRPGFGPSVVSGTSIGAITAAVLAGAKGDPVEALERLWNERLPVPSPVFGGAGDPTAWWPPELKRSLSALGNQGMYRVRAEWLCAPWASTSVYDMGPLRATLGDLADLDKLNDGEIRVILGAIDIASGEAEYFDTSERRLLFDHVLASGSLPPSFPPTEIGGRAYWDGGLFANTPLSPAINALEECDGGDPTVVRELIVVELFPMRGDVPRTMADVLDRTTQLRYTSRLTLDRKFFDKVNDEITLFQEIDDALPRGSAVRKDETYKAMRRHRRIDTFKVVTADFPDAYANASDFSADSIEARISAGYDNAVAQGIGVVPAH